MVNLVHVQLLKFHSNI